MIDSLKGKPVSVHRENSSEEGVARSPEPAAKRGEQLHRRGLTKLRGGQSPKALERVTRVSLAEGGAGAQAKC